MKLFVLLLKFILYLDLADSVELAPRRSDFLLPTTFKPVDYVIQIHPYFPAEGVQYDSSLNFTFDGCVCITMLCLEATDKITLHMKNINLNNSTIQLNDSDTDTVIQTQLDYKYNETTEQVTFLLSQALVANRRYYLNMSYTGELRTSGMKGIYPSSYVENGRTKWLVATQFQPTEARSAFPCFDEPFYKATFSLIIVHPPNMKVLANTKQHSTKEALPWRITMFKETPKMSSYLLAFAICDFDSKSSFTRNNKTLFNIWARPSFVDSLHYASEIGPKLLDSYEEFFDIPFPLEEQDMLAVPDFGQGAMENWGLVVYRENLLLHNERLSSSQSRYQVAFVVAHELAHQWFGNLVTMNWWSDLWLSEGLATYMESVGVDIVSAGKYKGDEMLVNGAVAEALKVDALTTSHPVFMPVETPAEIMGIFDPISYSKGAAVVRMLKTILGETVFRDGLRKYMKKHKYGSAGHNDLWNSWNEVIENSPTPPQGWSGGRFNVKEFMDPWILQIGFPLLTVNRSYGNHAYKTAVVTQTKFEISKNRSVDTNNKFLSPPFNFTWYVPVNYLTGNDPTERCDWLIPNENLTLQATGDNDWLLVNVDVSAFCRVNYDERNWKLLTLQLLTDHTKIGVKNRAQLLSDSFELAQAGIISYRIPLDMSTYLFFEDALIPWRTAGANFHYFELMLSASVEDYQNLVSFITGLTVHQFNRLGWGEPSETLDDMHIRSLRTLLVEYRVVYGARDASDIAAQMFTAYTTACSGDDAISSSCSNITADLRYIVYCAGVKAKPNSWHRVWRLHELEQVNLEKERLLHALTCTPDESLLTRILNETLNTQSTIIKQQDAPHAFGYLSMNKNARSLLWPFLVQNWDFFKNNASGDYLSYLVECAAAAFNTEYHIEQMRTFLNRTGGNVGSAQYTYEQVMEKVEVNVQWMTERSGAVKEWFNNHPFKGGVTDVRQVKSKLLARISLD